MELLTDVIVWISVLTGAVVWGLGLGLLIGWRLGLVTVTWPDSGRSQGESDEPCDHTSGASVWLGREEYRWCPDCQRYTTTGTATEEPTKAQSPNG